MPELWFSGHLTFPKNIMYPKIPPTGYPKKTSPHTGMLTEKLEVAEAKNCKTFQKLYKFGIAVIALTQNKINMSFIPHRSIAVNKKTFV